MLYNRGRRGENMPKITKKHIGVATVIVVLLLIIYGVRSCGSEVEFAYEYEKASIGNVEKTVAATGLLDVYEKQAVLCKTSGFVNSVRVNPEQKITKGQILATLDASEIEQKLLRLSTRIESSRLAVISAERRYKGKKEMFNEKLISEKDLQQGELEYKTAANDHKLLQLEYNEASLQKKNTVIVSPIDGVVVQSFVGTVDKPDNSALIGNSNAIMFYVAPALDKMELLLDIDESDIGSIVKKQKVAFTVSAFPDKKFNGEIVSVSLNPVQKGGLVVYQPTVICDNSELMLRPGMTATATIMVAYKENVLRVSNQAFIVSPDFSDTPKSGTVIWVKSSNPLQTDPANMVEVKTGLSGDMYTEVTENIDKGDQVLVKIRQVDN